jgi:hypothetical protein
LDVFFGGATRGNFTTSSPARWRQALLYLGGPLANGLACILILGLIDRLSGPWWNAPPQVMMILLAFAGGNAIGFIGNLVPFRSKRSGLDSDGKLLINLFRRKDRGEDWHIDYVEILHLIRNGRDNEVLPRLRLAHARHPDVPAILALLIDRVGRIEGAMAAWRTYESAVQGLPEDAPDDAAVAWMNLNAAWEAIKTGEPGLIPLAERLSTTECLAIANLPSARATRGALHVIGGRFLEGADLLRPALRQIDNLRDRADLCTYLARAEREIETSCLHGDYLRLREHLLASA